MNREDASIRLKPSQSNDKYIDDMTMFMAWYNWYLHEQNRMLSTTLHWHLQNLPHRFSANSPLPLNQNTLDNRSAESTTVNNSGNNGTRRVGVSVKLASFKKRIAAELIDFFFLLFVKLFVITYCIGEKYFERFHYSLIIDENTTVEDLQATIMQAILLRLVAVAYEGYYLSGTLPFSNGSTLGKRIMGLQVIRCDIVESLEADGIMVFVVPGNKVGIIRSMIRAVMKNTIISLFFPMLLPFHVIANHNRLIYDFATGTIVIERM